MNEQPMALLLADELDRLFDQLYPVYDWRPHISDAGDELRRLHAVEQERDQLADEKQSLIDSIREELDEGLRLCELGGAGQDENITAMTERVIRERDALRADRDSWQQQASDRYTLNTSVQAFADGAVYAQLQSIQQPAPVAPAGWVLVPVEPTPEMLAAASVGRVVRGYVGAQEKMGAALAQRYRAMLAAAPQPAPVATDRRTIHCGNIESPDAFVQPAPVQPCKGIPDPACHYLASCGSICNKCGREHRNVAPIPAAQPSDERATFEAFASNCQMGRFNVNRKGDGYWSSHTQVMWDTWEARAVLALRPVAQPLTDEQIAVIVREAASGAATRRDGTTSTRIVRLTERAHGIGQEGGPAMNDRPPSSSAESKQ